MKFEAEYKGKKSQVEKNGSSFYSEGQEFHPRLHGRDTSEMLLSLNQKMFRVQLLSVSEDGLSVSARINGKTAAITLKNETQLLLEKMGLSSASAAGSGKVKAPMPGLIVKIHVQPGDLVEKGQVLLNFEAMKMENQLKSPQAGTVKEVKVSPGDKVDKGQFLVEIS